VNAAIALSVREIVRLVREPTRIVALLGTTLLFWLVVGGGFADSFAAPDASGEGDGLSYGAYLLPGMVAMVVLFGTIVGAIGLIQDRHDGFLQSVLVSPAPAWSVALSKTFGGVCTTLAQALPILLAAPLLGLEVTALGVATGFLAIACMAVGVLNVGLLLAWRIDSVAGFHGVMNLILLPMWLLSGALFPAEGAAGWMRVIMYANPLHWCHRATAGSLGIGEPAGALAWIITLLFALGAFGVVVVQMSRRTTVGGPS
jgi:ABC-2 type transport system permease protein